ncbi:hypothetical protein QOZ80_1BG0065250 [Eleusine coracana subsp. coracana]|nr:hypothetical protein QOZ80_1BG0065250 [Eleusine coracana subsp. coracana]
MAESSTTGQMTSLTMFETREIRFTVDGYAATKEMADHGDHYESDKFLVGRYDWAVRYYPNNDGSHVSVTLVLLTTPKDGDLLVGTRFTCAIQERQGNPSAETHACTSYVFSEYGNEKGFWRFLTHDALEGSDYIVDDCFTLVCTVSVLKKPQPSRV